MKEDTKLNALLRLRVNPKLYITGILKKVRLYPYQLHLIQDFEHHLQCTMGW